MRISRSPLPGVFQVVLTAYCFCVLGLVASGQSSPTPTPTPTPTPAVEAEISTDRGGAKGVNPADNITKVEILPRLQVIGDDISILAVAIKYDRALNSKWGINVELPILRFQSPFGSDNGLGDVAFRFRYQSKPAKRVTLVTGGEIILPTATATSLGGGKLQVNPVVAAVYQVSNNVFAAGVVKQLFSVAGRSGREQVLQGQYRFLSGYISRKGWWFLADPQFWLDFKKNNRAEVAAEFEVGKMVGPATGVWIRSGGHIAGGWQRQEWNVGGGVRFIF